MEKQRSVVKGAVLCLVTYGMLVLAQAVSFGVASEWSDASGFVRAVVRCAGVALVAMYVLRLKRWAWCLALAGSVILLGLWAVAMPFLVASLRQGTLPLGGLSAAFAAGVGATLLGAVVCLLAPQTRHAVFVKPA